MTKQSGLTAFLLACCMLQYTNCQKCDLTPVDKDAEVEPFPDLFTESTFSYQMTVEYTPTNAKQSDYFKEYYDKVNKRGRVDMHINGSSSSYYYYEETNEAFEVSGYSCISTNMTGVNPKFVKEFQTEWQYIQPGEREIRGPSAMFRYALQSWTKKDKNMSFIGTVSAVRGIQAKLWRRCTLGMVFDYYFSALGGDVDPFKYLGMVAMPLRVVVSKEGDTSGIYPQNYEILIFQPYVSDEETTLEVPTGKGCVRSDFPLKPDLPKYTDSNIFTMAEVVCHNCDEAKPGDGKSLWDYYSAFTFAYDTNTDHVAYVYTRWGEVDKDTKKQLPGAVRHVIYDAAKEYLYIHDLSADTCEITRQPSYSPRYFLPRGNGYIDLTDEFLFYPDQEYSYLDDGVYKGMPVYVFEAVEDGYPLGNRSVDRAIFSRFHFRDSLTDNENIVPGALSALQIKLYPEKAYLNKSFQLNFNFYGFSTQIPYKKWLFGVSHCFKNVEDSSWMTLAFPADPPTLGKLQDVGPDIELEVFDSLLMSSQLNALRIPTMMLDVSDAVYVTMQILERPPINLDFKEPEEGKTISKTTRVEGLTDREGCSKICTQEENSCWGIALCGQTCYIGTDNKTQPVVQQKDCTLYRRYPNWQSLPFKDSLINNLKRLVETHQLHIVIPRRGPNGTAITLEASYIDATITKPDGSGDVLSKLRKKVDDRMRVVKPNAKLVKTGELVKNLGSLSFEKCQQVCLNYRDCETVSYCAKGHECVLSKVYGEDLTNDQISTDNYCEIVTRKYNDHFITVPGTVMSRNSRKSVKARNVEECAKLCLKEGDFQCFSFDFCPWDTAVTCRLHDVTSLDLTGKESPATNATCEHHYKKYSYEFKRTPNKRSADAQLTPVYNLTLERCAKTCVEMANGSCLGYDFCQDKEYTATQCVILVDPKIADQTVPSDICSHFNKLRVPVRKETETTAPAAWIGVVCFFVAAIVGILGTFGIAYLRVNRS